MRAADAQGARTAATQVVRSGAELDEARRELADAVRRLLRITQRRALRNVSLEEGDHLLGVLGRELVHRQLQRGLVEDLVPLAGARTRAASPTALGGRRLDVGLDAVALRVPDPGGDQRGDDLLRLAGVDSRDPLVGRRG